MNDLLLLFVVAFIIVSPFFVFFVIVRRNTLKKKNNKYRPIQDKEKHDVLVPYMPRRFKKCTVCGGNGKTKPHVDNRINPGQCIICGGTGNEEIFAGHKTTPTASETEG